MTQDQPAVAGDPQPGPAAAGDPQPGPAAGDPPSGVPVVTDPVPVVTDPVPVAVYPAPGPRRAVRWWSPARLPAFWLTLLVLVPASLAIGVLAVVMAVWSPRSALTCGLAAAGYTGLWLLVLLRWVDPVERRPVWPVLLAVVWGGTVAGIAGGGGGYFIDDVLARGVSATFSATWGAALSAPTAEEPAKLAGVALLLLAARPYLTTAWSGALYGALVGVGFAAVEDVGYALDTADSALPDDVLAALRVILLRFLVPGLVGHPLFTAVTGAGLGYALLRRGVSRWRRAGVFAAAFGGSWLMHAAVNSPLAIAAADRLTGATGAAVLAGYFLTVGAVALVPAVVLALLRRRDAVVVLSRAAAIEPSAIRPDEVAALAGARRRGREVRAVARTGGLPAARALRRLRSAQLRLAAVVNRPHGGYPAVGPGWRAPAVRRELDEIDAARRDLPDASGPPEAPDAAGLPHAAGPADAPDAAGRSPDGRRTGIRTMAAVAVLAASVVGLAVWPVAVGTVAGAAWLTVLVWRRPVGRLAGTAVVAGMCCGYIWAASLVLTVLFPE